MSARSAASRPSAPVRNTGGTAATPVSSALPSAARSIAARAAAHPCRVPRAGVTMRSYGCVARANNTGRSSAAALRSARETRKRPSNPGFGAGSTTTPQLSSATTPGSARCGGPATGRRRTSTPSARDSISSSISSICAARASSRTVSSLRWTTSNELAWLLRVRLMASAMGPSRSEGSSAMTVMSWPQSSGNRASPAVKVRTSRAKSAAAPTTVTRSPASITVSP